MLEDDLKEKYYGDVEMRLSPKEEYLINKSKQTGFENGLKKYVGCASDNTHREVAKLLLSDGFLLKR